MPNEQLATIGYEGATSRSSEDKPLTGLPDAAEVKKKWDDGVSRRRDIDREASTNLAFIVGEQYVRYNEKRKNFVKVVNTDQKVRLTVNLIKPLWLGEVSTMTEGRPIPEVTAASDSETDIAASKIGGRILDHELRRMDFDAFRTELVAWQSAAGLVYAHPYWDPEFNEICVDIVPHFELVADPAVRRSIQKDALWVIHGKVMTKDQAFEKFGRDFDVTQHQTPFSMQTLLAGNRASLGGKMEGVLVLRMWHRPSKRHPDGFVVTVVNDEVVEKKPFPYKHKELPFIDFHHVRVPGRFEGQSNIVDLVPLQKDYNQSRSRIAEARALAAQGRMLAPENSLDASRITNTPGEVVFYRPIGAYRPEPLPTPQPPNFLFSETDKAYTEMQDIMGQHEVSRGQVPSSGLSGAAVVALQEKDERKIALTMRRMENGIARIGKHILSMVQQYWEDGKLIRTWSEETGEWETERFASADIDAQLDVAVVPGSALPKSKAQTRQDLISLWRERIIQDPRIVLKAIEVPNVEGLLKTLDLDARHAKREHDLIYKGEEVVLADTFHNHEVHIAEHNDFRKTEAFETWAQGLRDALADHVAQHEEAQAALLQEQMVQAMMAQAGGALPEEGAPGANPPAPSQAPAPEGEF